jgi:hypothetical protein
VLYQVPLRQALREVLVDEHLDGAVTIRARDGALLPVVPVVPVADPPALTPVPRPPARPVAESVGAGMGPLLLVARGALPVVPLRELAVYEQVAREEVARAAGLG